MGSFKVTPISYLCAKCGETYTLRDEPPHDETCKPTHGWRPIDSAPKDDGPILGYGWGVIWIACWDDIEEHWYTPHDSGRPRKSLPLSHWMPLPTEPAPDVW